MFFHNSLCVSCFIQNEIPVMNDSLDFIFKGKLRVSRDFHYPPVWYDVVADRFLGRMDSCDEQLHRDICFIGIRRIREQGICIHGLQDNIKPLCQWSRSQCLKRIESIGLLFNFDDNLLEQVAAFLCVLVISLPPVCEEEDHIPFDCARDMAIALKMYMSNHFLEQMDRVRWSSFKIFKKASRYRENIALNFKTENSRQETEDGLVIDVSRLFISENAV